MFGEKIKLKQAFKLNYSTMNQSEMFKNMTFLLFLYCL